jgi:radical SAM superfamily enzyme YgiQ (UPF0313 family)
MISSTMHPDKKLLVLISPTPKGKHFGTAGLGVPALNLAYVAAMVPDHWDVQFIEESCDRHDYPEADLVGLTAVTAVAPRAYEISRRYREKGILTVMGGPHASVLHEEALAYVDTVVVGEAEPVFPDLIRDFEKAEMKRLYKAPLLPMENWPKARYDLVEERFSVASVNTTRGCPYRCEFCSVPLLSPVYRARPIEEVIEDLEMINSPMVYFADENFVLSGKKWEERGISLLRRIAERDFGKIYVGCGSINFADSEGLLQGARDAGMALMFLGIESVTRDCLREMNKRQNLKNGKVADFHTVIRRFHDYGMAVMGGFIVGVDSDTTDTLKALLDFIEESEIDVPQITFLAPFPGTPLFERIRKENRLIYRNYPADWEHYNQGEPMIVPRNMTVSQLVRGRDGLLGALFSEQAVTRRVANTKKNTGSDLAETISEMSNSSLRKLYRGIVA